MNTETEKRDAEDILEFDAGCQYHQALIVMEARGACEQAYENFRYDEKFPAEVLAAYKLIAGTPVYV